MHIAEIKQAAILLSFAIKPLGIRKLKGNSLTAPDRNRVVRRRGSRLPRRKLVH